MLVHGFFTEKQVACYSDFFSTGVDKAIKEIINIDNNIADILVGDIVEAFHMGIPLQTTPTLSSLCELWLKKVHKTEVYNQYFMLIIVCIRKIAMEQVISEAPCTLSGEYIRSILNIFNIKKNKDGCYDISSFKKLKYDLCLMSELPTSGIPMHKKIYLEKKDNKLRYLVLHPKENYVCDELLNIDVPQGDLSQEFLNNKATYILKEVFYALNFRIEGGGITTDTINPLTKKYIHYNDIRFLRESIEDFTECTIKQILQLWIDKVNLELDAKTVVFFSQGVLDIFRKKVHLDFICN